MVALFSNHQLVPVSALISVLFTSVAVSADNISIVGVQANIEAESSIFEPEQGTLVDSDEASTKLFSELPITASSSIESSLGSATSSGEVWGLHTNYLLSLSTDGVGTCVTTGDPWVANAQGRASGSFSVQFSVDRPTPIRVILVVNTNEYEPLGGGCGSASVDFWDDSSLVTLLDTEKKLGSWNADFEMLLEPGHVYSVSGSSNAVGSSSTDCLAGVTARFEVLCGSEGTAVLGDNAFDTEVRTGVNLDLTDQCSPGPYGDDVFYNTIYFGFIPKVTTTYTFSTCNQASFDTRLAVLTDLCEESTVLECLDDTANCANFTTELTLPLDAGREYWVAIGGFSESDYGFGVLTARFRSDVNGDGFIDGADLATILGSWGPCEGCPADIDGNGVVDGADIAQVLGAWMSE